MNVLCDNYNIHFDVMAIKWYLYIFLVVFFSNKKCTIDFRETKIPKLLTLMVLNEGSSFLVTYSSLNFMVLSLAYKYSALSVPGKGKSRTLLTHAIYNMLFSYFSSRKVLQTFFYARCQILSFSGYIASVYIGRDISFVFNHW